MIPLKRYALPNIGNFRDVGGHAARDGKMTRWGVFYRSGRLCRVTPQEAGVLKAMGIRTIIDLRMSEEVEARPDTIMEDPDLGYTAFSLMGDAAIDPEEFLRNPDESPPMATLYLHMFQHCQAEFRVLFEMLADRVRHGAVLFHCTAGKDRTGLVAMLLQSLCGVDRLDILADYQISKVLNTDFLPEDTTGSDPGHMLTALEYLDERHGGPACFLSAIGIRDDTLGMLSDRLLGDCPL
ncbi:tyrosine-protein phosphatase [Eubacteriales bacterium OttesenSCG-928-A19]|nr:tyrosine-protein phosphatase [Eubacteriales bacterium OttesenSCG-928-A19]